MTAHLPVPTFTPPATLYLASFPPEPAAEGRAAAALFGAPLDLTETFRSGAHGGPSAVRWMSDSLETYSPVLDRALDDVRLLDLGDLPLAEQPMDDALEAIARAMAHAATLGRLGIMLGGEHTGSLGGFRGIKRVYPDAAIVQVDAHLDFREEYEGERLTHASWLYHAGSEFDFRDIIQVGLRSGERAEWRSARERTTWTGTDLALPPAIRAKIADRPVYLSIDIDVLDPAFAPGTGCPEPGGVSFRELQQFLYSLAGLHLAGMDVMEVSPSLDPASITAVAAAKLVREAVLMVRE